MNNLEIAVLAADIIMNPSSRAGDPVVTVSRSGRTFEPARGVSLRIDWEDESSSRVVVSDTQWVVLLSNHA